MATDAGQGYPVPVLNLPQWAHELATFATLAAAAGYLTVHMVRVARPRGSVSGCSSCGQNPSPASASARGRRSAQLRVIRE